MPKLQSFNISGINLKLSPFLQGQGQVLHALNVKRDMIGGWKKRPGYITFLGTPDNSQVNTLGAWLQNDGASLFVYRASGSTLYHSIGGTGAWTTSGGGTITANAHFGFTVLDNTLIGGDGTAASRHSTNGTSFTNTSGAPLAEHWTEYQGRTWAARGTAVSGTNTDMFFSTTGTATDWTTDSSSIRIPGPGRVNSLFKSANRIVDTKDAGGMFIYDGETLSDLSTDLGPSSPYSIGEKESYRFYLNRTGVYGYVANSRPDIVSTPIERLIYNDSGSAIAGTTFDNAPGICYKSDYLLSVGTITDDLIQETTPNAVLKYDYQNDEWVRWQFANRPTAFGTYQDLTGNQQLIWGDSGGQCYQMAGTATSDNGNAIESVLMGFIHGGNFDDKKWNWITGMFNPGCKAKIQFAISDTFTPPLNWIDAGDATDGVVEYRFPAGSRGKFLFWKIYEYSSDKPWAFLGWEYDASLEIH